VSEYIANLNAIPTAQDLQSLEDFTMGDSLAMFTNTEFFDFDLGHNADLEPTHYGIDKAFGAEAADTVAPESVDVKSADYMNENFSFPDFHTYPPPPGPFDSTDLTQVQKEQPLFPDSSVSSPVSDLPSSKRKADQITSPNDIELSSRIAAEEDKRRRNTAASARFRVKKKQREQALERSAKEMSDKVSALENRIGQLETENKWLKNLITEKNEGKEGDIARLWAKFNAENAAKASAGKDGVGTSA